MNEGKVGAILLVVGIVLLLFGWALDRSELKGRSLRRPRALVSTIGTWGGFLTAFLGVVLISEHNNVSF